MSSRSTRVSRRADERARHREALDAVDPSMGGRASHHVCLVPDCDRHGPRVLYGSIALTLCPAHKSDFDSRWELAHTEIELVG